MFNQEKKGGKKNKKSSRAYYQPPAGSTESPLHLLTLVQVQMSCNVHQIPITHTPTHAHTQSKPPPSALNYADLYLFNKEALLGLSLTCMKKRRRGAEEIKRQDAPRSSAPLENFHSLLLQT